MDHSWQYFANDGQKKIISLLKEWHDTNPDSGVYAMVAEADKEIVYALQKVCREVGTQLIGGVFPQLVVSSQLKERGVLLLRLDTMPKYVLSGDLTTSEALEQLLQLLQQSLKRDEKKTLFMLFDGLLPNIASILERCYLEMADRVSYEGANAGSESFHSMSCLFDRERFEKNSVLAVLFPQSQNMFIGHGYSLPDKLTSATSSSENCIQSIDWRPAFEVYQELATAQYGVSVTKDNFYSVGVKFPLGIVRANGEVLVRIPVALMEDGSLLCAGEVPENSLLTLLESNEREMMQGVMALAERVAKSNLPQGITFYCAGRKLFLGSVKSEEELKVFSQHAGEVNGAISLGEIGSLKNGGYPLFHNGALVHCSYL